MRQDAIITDGRTLRAMHRRGLIVWHSTARDRHWTGATVRRLWVAEGPKLENRYGFAYRGRTYRLEYFDGCFHPFVVQVSPPPACKPSFV